MAVCGLTIQGAPDPFRAIQTKGNTMKMSVMAALLAASFGAGATNNHNNPPPKGGDNEFSANSQSSSHSTGIGVGVGIGGDSSASVGDIRNTNTAAGGSVIGSGNSYNHNSATGGQGGSAVAVGGKGGSAHQGQVQGQIQGQSTDVNASSSNDNRSNASGNATNVNIGGDTYQAKRNAPSIMAGSVFPTASCKSGFGIGGSGAAGGGLLNIATTDKECQTVVLSQNFSAIGRDETACLLLKTTRTWERSVKKDPALASLDCSPKPAPAPVVVPALVAPEIAHRVPRG